MARVKPGMAKKVRPTQRELIILLAFALERLIRGYRTGDQHDLIMHECEKLLCLVDEYRWR